jgi:tRNA(fMet)-specific endonuclease VapC
MVCEERWGCDHNVLDQANDDRNCLSERFFYSLNDCSPRMAMHKAVAAISVITRAEIRYGQALMAANDKRHQRINLLIEQLPALPWTDAAADCYASIRATLKPQGLPVGELDTQIAAHALAEKLVLVTHNTHHFENVRGLRIKDWMF